MCPIWKQTEAVYGAELRYWRKRLVFGSGRTGVGQSQIHKMTDGSRASWNALTDLDTGTSFETEFGQISGSDADLAVPKW